MILRFATLCLLLLQLTVNAANLLDNGTFDNGLKSWWSMPSAPQAAQIIREPNSANPVLELIASQNNIAINSKRLQLGRELFRNRTYKVSCNIKVQSIRAGAFAATVTMFDATGKFAAQKAFFSANGTTDPRWMHTEFLFGNGTRFIIPENATEIAIRFSFWDKSGKCDGNVLIDNVDLQEMPSPAATVNSPNTVITTPIPFRAEERSGKHYFWIEAEDFAPRNAVRGAWHYQQSWTRAGSAMPNESGYHSLVRPEWRNPATASGSLTLPSGQYYIFARLGTFRPWGKQAVTVTVNGKPFTVAPEAKDPILTDAFTWEKLNTEPIRIDGKLDFSITNDIIPANHISVDCFLITDNPDYAPPRRLPARHRFSINENEGPVMAADFWHATVLESPVYLCRDSSQQFLFRLRNFSAMPQEQFFLDLTLPAGVMLEDATRAKRWPGDSDQWKRPHFIHNSPDRIERQTLAPGEKNQNRYRLFFDRPFPAYNPQDKTIGLFFLVLTAADIAPGKYELSMIYGKNNVEDPATRTTQTLEILPELSAPQANGYRWGVDAIYASLLSETEQKKLLSTFADAGINLWASRVRESHPAFSQRNKEHWQLVRQQQKMQLANWGEFWWPGTPYNNASLEYIRKHPEKLGIHRNDDRGIALKGKLICPEILLKEDDTYLKEHLQKFTALLQENGITEVIEDVEFSSPLSYCFCDRCKKKFAEYAKLDFIKVQPLPPDSLLRQHQELWIDFRCAQNVELLNKISRIAKELYPAIRYNLFCGYQSAWVRQRYGVEWAKLLPLPNIAGIYIGGGVPGTAPQIIDMKSDCEKHQKNFISMANATLSFPNGYDEIAFRSQPYLEARIIHDLMCGSDGLFIWWWGTLDGRCLKAYETGTKIASRYGDMLQNGKRTFCKIGQNDDFYLLTVESDRGKLLALTNPSRYSEDMILDQQPVWDAWGSAPEARNLLTGKNDTRASVAERLNRVFRSGAVELWFIPTRKQQ